MKRIGIPLLLIVFGAFAHAQTFNIQAGTSISKLNWELSALNTKSIYNKTLLSYSALVGVNYIDKKYFNLSSNIGLIKRGGKANRYLNDSGGKLTGEVITEKPALDYLTFNTTIDLKYPLNEKLVSFISCGPRIDYLLNSSNHFDILSNMNELEDVLLGALIGGGVRYTKSNMQYGFRVDYYADLTNPAEWTVENVSGKVSLNTLTVNCTVGYKLK